eukprot:1192180-Prorocentrum_minimum.AAC.3
MELRVVDLNRALDLVQRQREDLHLRDGGALVEVLLDHHDRRLPHRGDAEGGGDHVGLRFGQLLHLEVAGVRVGNHKDEDAVVVLQPDALLQRAHLPHRLRHAPPRVHYHHKPRVQAGGLDKEGGVVEVHHRLHLVRLAPVDGGLQRLDARVGQLATLAYPRRLGKQHQHVDRQPLPLREAEDRRQATGLLVCHVAGHGRQRGFL